MPLETNRLFLPFLGLVGVLSWCGLDNGHDWGGDFSAYIMQAESIVRGTTQEFIAENRFTVENSTKPWGPFAYPWGFPVLLAPVYALFGLDLMAMKLVLVTCYLAFLCVIWFGFRKTHSSFWRAVLVGLFALNPTMLDACNRVLSDIPFLLLSTVSVFLIGIVVVERRTLVSRVLDQILLGTAIAVAFFLRTNGLLLLVTLGVAQAISLSGAAATIETSRPARLKRILSWRDPAARNEGVMSALPYAAFSVALLAWKALFPEGGSSQLSHFEGLTLELVKHHLHYYIDLPVAFFSSAPHPYLLYGASIPLAVGGVIKRCRSEHYIIAYMAMTVMLYVVWPPVEGLRFLFPVLPFYFSFVLSGLEACEEALGARRRVAGKAICAVPILSLLLCFGGQSVGHALDNLQHGRQPSSGPFAETSKDAFAFIDEHTEPDGVVVFFKPRVMRLMTGRRSVMIDDVGQLPRGEYLCLYRRRGLGGQISADEFRQLVAGNRAEILFQNRDFILARLSAAEG